MAISQGRPSVDLDFILNNVGEFNILSHYLGISHIPCLIPSPLRIDNHPSFGLWSKDGVKIKFTDFATGDNGDMFDLLGRMWNTDYQGVLSKIQEDLPSIPLKEFKISTSNNINHTLNRKIYHSDTKLECKIRSWKKHDIEYWEQYGISLKWLKFGDVYPISHTILTKEDKKYIIPAEKYAYAYVERKDNVISLKIYQPYSENFKWRNKHDGSVWDLWTKLPEKGEHLIITSSRKDALTIWENTGIPAISLQAESYLPKHSVVQQLKDRFKYIYVLYDNDFNSINKNYGRIFGKSMANEFDLIQLEIPDEYKSKDTSDLCKNYGRQETRRIILQLIENSKIMNNNEDR